MLLIHQVKTLREPLQKSFKWLLIPTTTLTVCPRRGTVFQDAVKVVRRHVPMSLVSAPTATLTSTQIPPDTTGPVSTTQTVTQPPVTVSQGAAPCPGHVPPPSPAATTPTLTITPTPLSTIIPVALRPL